MSKRPKRTIEILCYKCGKTFEKNRREYTKKFNQGQRNFLCNPNCSTPKESHPCPVCSAPTTNPKFCSRSCSAKISGSLFPKRHKTRTPHTCGVCNSIYFMSKNHKAPKKCPSCYDLWKTGVANNQTTLLSIVSSDSLKGKHPSFKFVKIRELARSRYRHLLKLSCARCGYSLHVEICHIKPISLFPLSATLGEINDPSNIIQFCGNCHWEFDHHLFNLEDLPRIELGSTA